MKTAHASTRGFTLIELMIVVAIIGILAAIAYPSYVDSVRQGRRSDGIAALTAVQLAQEKFRASCRFYAGNLGGANDCDASAAASTVKASNTSPDGHYTIRISSASATGYTATATGVGGQANDNEGGTVCTLTITVSAGNPNGQFGPAACWSR